MDQTQPPTQQPLQTPPEAFVSQPKPNYLKIIIFSVLIIITLSLIGFLFFQNQQLKTESKVTNFIECSAIKGALIQYSYPDTCVLPSGKSFTQELSPEEKSNLIPPKEIITEPSTSISPDETAGWKTYTNNVRNYSIKYPSDWKIDTSQAELPINDTNSAQLLITQGEYKITILWPSAFGPGICIFDDQSRIGAPEMASYCEGKYIELNSEDNKNIYRRLVNPESFSEHNQWEVYTKSKDSFVTVPPTRFIVPLQYQLSNIYIMDKILTSLKFK